MDMSSVHHVKSQNMKRGRRKTNNNNKKSVKVVYISTPMKVNTSVSKFRALVQELTGRDSDMSRFADFDAQLSEKSWEYEDNRYDNQVMVSNSDLSEKSWEKEDDQHQMISNNNDYNFIRPVIREFQSLETVDQDLSYDYSPTSSESLLDSFDDVISSQIVEELEHMFPSTLFGYDSSISPQNYVLGDSDYGLV